MLTRLKITSRYVFHQVTGQLHYQIECLAFSQVLAKVHRGIADQVWREVQRQLGANGGKPF